MVSCFFIALEGVWSCETSEGYYTETRVRCRCHLGLSVRDTYLEFMDESFLSIIHMDLFLE